MNPTSFAFLFFPGEFAELDEDEQFCAFVRLAKGVTLGDLTEVPIPSRFLFILMGPESPGHRLGEAYHEIGRCLATIMSSDKLFNHVAYRTNSRYRYLVCESI